MSIVKIMKKTINWLLPAVIAFSFGCGTQNTPGGKTQKDSEIVSRWKSYLNDSGWESVNMVKLDIIITEQGRIQKFVSGMIQTLNELCDINEELKAGNLAKPELFASLLSTALNNLKNNVQNARTAYENYAFQMASTGVGQMIRDHYTRMMEGFPKKDHPTSKNILKYFTEMKGVSEKSVLDVLARPDYHETFLNDIFESIEERRNLFQGMEKLLVELTAEMESNVSTYFSSKNIPQLEQLSQSVQSSGSRFLSRAFKTILDNPEPFITHAKNKAACYASEGNATCLEGETAILGKIIAPVVILSARGLIAPTLVMPEELNITKSRTKGALDGVDAGWRKERTQTLFTPDIEMYNDPGYNDNTHVGGGDLDVTDLDDAIGMPNEYPLIYNNRTVKGLLIYAPNTQKWYLELDGEKIFIPNDSDISTFVRDGVFANNNRKWVKTVINFVVEKERINYATGDGYTIFLKAIEFMGEPGINLSVTLSDYNADKLLAEADASIIYSVLEDAKITSLVFYADGKILCEDTVAPYQCIIDKTGYAEGLHTVKVVAFDNAGTSAEKSANFAVDHKSPVVVKANPKGTGISFNSSIYLSFSEAMDENTLNAANIKITQNGTAVEGSFIYNQTTYQLTFVPAVPMTPGKTYQISVTQGVKDMCGTPLEYAYSWSFTTSGYSNNFDEALFGGSTFAQ